MILHFLFAFTKKNNMGNLCSRPVIVNRLRSNRNSFDQHSNTRNRCVNSKAANPNLSSLDVFPNRKNCESSPKLNHNQKLNNNVKNQTQNQTHLTPMRGVKKKAIPKALKRSVWDLYIGPEIGQTLCPCCMHVNIRQIEFHCGHVISEASGGETNVANLRPICAQCNLSMGTQNMEEFKSFFKGVK